MNKRVLLTATIAAVAGVLFGFDTGVISGAILFIAKAFQLSDVMNGVVVSTVLFGALMGAICSGRITDLVGRKRLLIFDACAFIVGTIICALAPNVTLLIIGRFIVGIAIGIASYTAPLYIAEIAPPQQRGMLVSLNQFFVTIGILASYIVDYAFSFTGNWRMMLGLGIIPAAILLIGVLRLPFSPRWLVARGKLKAAFYALRHLRDDHSQIKMEIRLIQKTLQHKHKTVWKSLLEKQVRPTLYIAVGLAIIQQITGINTILYYAPTILEKAGFHNPSTAIFASVFIGLFSMLATIAGLFFIDRIGRKPLLYTGMTLMTINLGILAWVFDSNTLNSTSAQYTAIISMIVYIIGFAISLGPIAWLLIAEVFPLRIRGAGASIATCANWSFNWLVAILFLQLIDLFGTSTTFLIYCIISLLSLIFVYAVVPETKGVALEQIEADLYNHVPARLLGSGKNVSRN